jgi:hypothetical protein
MMQAFEIVMLFTSLLLQLWNQLTDNYEILMNSILPL